MTLPTLPDRELGRVIITRDPKKGEGGSHRRNKAPRVSCGTFSYKNIERAAAKAEALVKEGHRVYVRFEWSVEHVLEVVE